VLDAGGAGEGPHDGDWPTVKSGRGGWGSWWRQGDGLPCPTDERTSAGGRAGAYGARADQASTGWGAVATTLGVPTCVRALRTAVPAGRTCTSPPEDPHEGTTLCMWVAGVWGALFAKRQPGGSRAVACAEAAMGEPRRMVVFRVRVAIDRSHQTCTWRGWCGGLYHYTMHPSKEDV
jgi:hypothetical protein